MQRLAKGRQASAPLRLKAPPDPADEPGAGTESTS